MTRRPTTNDPGPSPARRVDPAAPRPRAAGAAAAAALLTPQLLATAALLALGLAPAGSASGTPVALRDSLRGGLPNAADYDRMERGYYEQLLDAGRGPDDPAGGSLAGHAEPVAVEHGRLALPVADVREYVLKPGLSCDPGRKIPWATNGHGMRDRDYPEAKPPGTVRVGLAGDSIASGWGVGDEVGFEPRLERALDARSRGAGGPAVEVLNFAVPGHGPGQRWAQFEAVAWAFDPDLVLYEATAADLGWDERRLRGLLARGVGFDAPVYRDALRGAGVRPGLDAAGYKRALKPLRLALLAGVYRRAVAECRSRGVPVVYVLIPRVGKPADPADRRVLLGLARAAGFAAVVDASAAYDGADPRDLAVSPHDFHPNAEGHARVARLLAPALAGWARPRAAPTAAEGARPR